MIALYLALVDEEQKDKFEQVYYKYRNLLYYVAYEILQNERDAEDAVQRGLCSWFPFRATAITI